MFPAKTLTTTNKVYGDENAPDNEQDITVDSNFFTKINNKDQPYNKNPLSRSSECTNVIEECLKETTVDKSAIEDLNKLDKEMSKFSIFKEVDCGEPIFEQHLRIDFTPTEADTVEDREKCYEFWDFINSCSDLQKIKVYPIKSNPDSVSSQSTVINEPIIPLTPALDWVASDGKMTGALVSKYKKEYCEHGDEEYRDFLYEEQITKTMKTLEATNTVIPNFKSKQKQVKGKSKCHCVRKTAGSELSKLTSGMDEWDSLHPRSLEPPGQVPLLEHAIMQRRM